MTSGSSWPALGLGFLFCGGELTDACQLHRGCGPLFPSGNSMAQPLCKSGGLSDSAMKLARLLPYLSRVLCLCLGPGLCLCCVPPGVGRGAPGSASGEWPQELRHREWKSLRATAETSALKIPVPKNPQIPDKIQVPGPCHQRVSLGLE